MPGLAAWKLIIPLGTAAVGVLLLMRPDGSGPDLSPAASASRFATLGYLSAQEVPDAIALLRPPPSQGLLR